MLYFQNKTAYLTSDKMMCLPKTLSR